MKNFDNERWETERMARLDRQEINEAIRQVSKGDVQRICKPGKWRVFMRDGAVVVEDLTIVVRV